MAKPMPPFVEELVDLLSPLGEVRVKRMFGGFGCYVNELFMGLVAHDVLYLRVDDVTRPTFEQQGLKPFVYEVKDGVPHTMSYYGLPEDMLTSTLRLKPWAQLAIQAAQRAATAKPAKKKRAK
jgi:DNA transformation protein and related proteins